MSSVADREVVRTGCGAMWRSAGTARGRSSATPPRTTPCPNYFPVRNGAHTSMTISTTSPAAPQVAINDIGSSEDLLAAIDLTIKYFKDGDIVEGTIVK